MARESAKDGRMQRSGRVGRGVVEEKTMRGWMLALALGAAVVSGADTNAKAWASVDDPSVKTTESAAAVTAPTEASTPEEIVVWILTEDVKRDAESWKVAERILDAALEKESGNGRWM